MREVFRATIRDLFRDRFAILLLFVAPAVFLGITYSTASLVHLPIKLFGLDGVDRLLLRQRDVLVVFITASIEGFLSAFLASEMFSDRRGLGKLLVLSGLEASRWALGKLLAFVTVAFALALFFFGIALCLVPMKNPAACLLGALLLSLVYGLCGAVIGLATKETLRSILCILILADVDAAWLQNPVYYSYAQENELVRRFPAFHPIQESLAGAFAGRFNPSAILGSLGYAAILALPLALALVLRYGSVARASTRARGSLRKPNRESKVVNE